MFTDTLIPVVRAYVDRELPKADEGRRDRLTRALAHDIDRRLMNLLILLRALDGPTET
jgi:hypothetical protein